jgi:RNA polymerase sigma factor (sigma-70 family)
MNYFETKFEEKTGIKFKEYYKEYLPKLTWYLTRYTKNLELSEEFANMAFIQGLEKIDTYNPELSKFITWLTSIAVNLVIKDFKDKKKLKLISIDYEFSDNMTMVDFLRYEDGHEIKESEEENKAKCEIIKDVIDTLPEKYKRVMEMRELDKKPYKEIAENIKKEQDIDIINDIKSFLTNDFHSFEIINYGTGDVRIDFVPKKDQERKYNMVLLPNEKRIINKMDIEWEDFRENKIDVNSYNSRVKIKYIQTTNLSTIKSQIKKGRYLIKKKVKKDFDIIDKNGIK